MEKTGDQKDIGKDVLPYLPGSGPSIIIDSERRDKI